MFLAGMAASEEVGACVVDFCFTVDPGGGGKGVAILGAGMLVSGPLLATVWSDVPVVNSLDFVSRLTESRSARRSGSDPSF